MRYSYLLTLVLSLTLLGSCKKDADLFVPNDLFARDWYDTRQSSALGFKTYQVSSVPFFGWGIDGFRFESDGTFIQHSQGPNDGPLDILGTWTTVDGQTYRITVNFPQTAPYTYELLIGTVTSTSLTARRLP